MNFGTQPQEAGTQQQPATVFCASPWGRRRAALKPARFRFPAAPLGRNECPSNCSALAVSCRGWQVGRNSPPATGKICQKNLRAAVSHAASRSNQHSTRSKAGGWNRLHLIAGDLPGKVERLRAAGAQFRNEAAANRGSAVAQNEPTKLTEVYFPALTRSHRVFWNL